MAYKVHVLGHKNERCTSPFGERTIVINGRLLKGHSGIDLVPEGSIITPEDGVVTKVKNTVVGIDTSGMNDYGNYVYIKVNNTYTLFFAHLKKDTLKVRVGDRVKAGQVIGYTGSTGYSTGVHLHFGIQKNGAWIDPALYLNGNLKINGATAIVSHNLKVGDYVTIKKGACWSTGGRVPSYCIGVNYRVDAIATNNVLLDASGVNSRISPDYLVVQKVLKVGSYVSIMPGATYYESSTKVPSWVRSKVYRVDGIKGDRVLLEENGLNSAVDRKYLTVV